MSYGCASISFDCDAGPRHIIDNKNNGILIPKFDINLLSEAINDLLKNQEKRERLAIKALDVKIKFSEINIMNMWNNILC